MKIFAIDAGNTESGYAIINMPDFKILDKGKVNNEEMRKIAAEQKYNVDLVALEMVASYGMAVGKDVFETCVFIGRLAEICNDVNVDYIYRKDEKITICGSMKAKDSNIKQELINRYAQHDFKQGKGTKKNPDTFYGVAKDVWQAIAVGVTAYELKTMG